MSIVQELYGLTVMPPVSSSTAIAMANAVVAAVPEDAAADIKQAANKVAEDLRSLQGSWVDSARLATASSGSEAPIADQELDCAWSAFRDLLDGLARLPGDRYPRAVRAAQLREKLFPSGLGFLKLSFDDEWAHSDTLLKRIDADGMASQIDELIGTEPLGEVRRAHQRYGEVLGKTKGMPAADVDARGLLRKLTESIRLYALRVVASVDPERPETLASARKALEPLAAHREQSRRRRSSNKAATAATTLPAFSSDQTE
jgi:hypothetical protein